MNGTLPAALSIFLLVMAAGMPALAEQADYMSPKRQMAAGVSPQDVECRADRVLAVRDGGSPACVFEDTAHERGWEVRAEQAVTLVYDAGPAGAYASQLMEWPLLNATLTHPERFELGRPFTVNYTWTFAQSYSEADGDEWPQDDLEKYPWAQHWNPYLEGDDEDGNIWWKVVSGDRWHPGIHVRVVGNEGVRVLDGDFRPSGEFAVDPEEWKTDVIRKHPWDTSENNTGSITLRIDEEISPRENRHYVFVIVGPPREPAVFAEMWLHFDGGRGHIGDHHIRLFPSDAAASARLDLSKNPYSCWCDNRWDLLADDAKRWEHMYPESCEGKVKGNCARYDPYVPKKWPSDQEVLDHHVGLLKEWIDRNGPYEDGIRHYLENTLFATAEELERFFEVYPELVGKFLALLPEAHATQRAQPSGGYN